MGLNKIIMNFKIKNYIFILLKTKKIDPKKKKKKRTSETHEIRGWVESPDMYDPLSLCMNMYGPA